MRGVQVLELGEDLVLGARGWAGVGLGGVGKSWALNFSPTPSDVITAAGFKIDVLGRGPPKVAK
jgi:hypothetical protein